MNKQHTCIHGIKLVTGSTCKECKASQRKLSNKDQKRLKDFTKAIETGL